MEKKRSEEGEEGKKHTNAHAHEVPNPSNTKKEAKKHETRAKRGGEEGQRGRK